MKGKRNLFIGFILGALIGWIVAFFGSPYSFQNFSFLLGFIAGLVFLSLGLTLAFTWSKNPLRISFRNKKPTAEGSDNTAKSHALKGILTFVLIALGGLVSSFLIFKQQALFDAETQYQRKSIERQSALVEATQKGNLVFLMGNILDKVDEELAADPANTLSEETIARIADLSYSFKPYPYLEGDSVSTKKWSPERGQLLLALSKMNIAPSSFESITFKTSFAGADLSGADLRAVNLYKADLRAANLQEGNLRNAHFKQAEMREAILNNADLGGADLREADLKRTQLRWANLRKAQLSGADFSGADMTCVKLSKADLRGADLRWADLSGAFLDKAHLAGVKLSGTVLSRANLSETDLSNTDLRWTTLSEANLRKANLSKAKMRRANLTGADLSAADIRGVDFSVANLQGVELHQAKVEVENWMEQLAEWEVKGAERIREQYRVVKDSSGEGNFRLEKISEGNK